MVMCALRREWIGRGFTLIELLVLISIIAVLAALLIPTINMVRSSATKANCSSNQRQLALALVGYAEDYEGLMPLVYVEGGKQFLYYFMNRGGGRAGFGMLHEAEVLDTPKAYFCPAYTRPYHQYDTPQNPWPPSSAKTRAGYGLRPVVNRRNDGRFDAPLPLIGDFGTTRAVSSCLMHHRLTLEYGHGDGVNVGYGDGHVSWVGNKRFGSIIDGIDPGQASNAQIDAVFAIFDAQVE